MVLAARFAEETAMERGRPLRGTISQAAWQLLLAHAGPAMCRELRDVDPFRAVVRSEDEVEPITFWPRGGARSRAPRAHRCGLSLRELAELGAAEAEQQAIPRSPAQRRPRQQERGGPLLKTDYKTLARAKNASVRHHRRRAPAPLDKPSAVWEISPDLNGILSAPIRSG
jgi:hypothetical protein